MSGRFRNVCFTSFGDEPEYVPSVMSYLIYGLECCNTTGRWHWQGYVEFSRQLSSRQLKEILHNSHFERRHGDAQSAATYCTKDGEYCEYGTISRQGARSDLQEISQSIVDGSSILSIAQSHPRLFVQYGRGLSLLQSVCRQSSQRQWRRVQVEIWWGLTGTGKTRTFFSQYPVDDCYRFLYRGSTDYWDGYTGQHNVLFDEFESQVRLSDMLMYMDGHPLLLNIKFAHGYADWDTVTIISNSNPQTFYANCSNERRDAFARRVTRVIEHVDNDTRIISHSFAFNHSVINVTADADFS